MREGAGGTSRAEAMFTRPRQGWVSQRRRPELRVVPGWGRGQRTLLESTSSNRMAVPRGGELVRDVRGQSSVAEAGKSDQHAPPHLKMLILQPREGNDVAGVGGDKLYRSTRPAVPTRGPENSLHPFQTAATSSERWEHCPLLGDTGPCPWDRDHTSGLSLQCGGHTEGGRSPLLAVTARGWRSAGRGSWPHWGSGAGGGVCPVEPATDTPMCELDFCFRRPLTLVAKIFLRRGCGRRRSPLGKL